MLSHNVVFAFWDELEKIAATAPAPYGASPGYKPPPAAPTGSTPDELEARREALQKKLKKKSKKKSKKVGIWDKPLGKVTAGEVGEAAMKGIKKHPVAAGATALGAGLIGGAALTR
jgi:hypothetical protein